MIIMFFDDDINGNGLPWKTICLTFDDGPGETAGDGAGPRTAELGSYLVEQGIAATFFVVGKFAAGLDHVLSRLRAEGHLVANHTFDHLNLLRIVPDERRLVEQLLRADERIRPHVDGGTVFVRPPYGAWRPDGQATSQVAQILNRSRRLGGHVGPVSWDAGGSDWTYWRDRRSPEECARHYLAQIERTGRGIVLLHDSTADIGEVRRANRTFQMATLLVPELLQRGYRFVRLDTVPQVASAVAVSFQATLRAPGGLCVKPRGPGNCEIWAETSPTGSHERFGVVALGGGRIALRAANGRFLAAPPGVNGPVLATAPFIGERETLDLEDLGANLVALRTARGAYLGCQPRLGGRLTAGFPSEKTAHSIFKLIKDEG
jgi:peptidoglycan/xylan/chitin deacetylase (PgdA/CDA1 family)